jgi:hypothetical protein
MKYEELFAYIEEKCNFQGVDEDATWKCDGKLTFTKSFCKEHGLDFNKIKVRLNELGGNCDCEVLFNVLDYRIEEEEMPASIQKEKKRF